jgi:uncharacterized protein YeaC (DUF1315 family)
MPTLSQQQTFQEVMGQVSRGERPNISKAMRKVGYKKSTWQKTGNLTNSRGWQELLGQIEDKDLLDRVREIALAKEDKRASLQAVDMLWKLKDRYPAGKLKVTEYAEEVQRLQD